MKRVKDYMKKDSPVLYKNTPMNDVLQIFSNSQHNILPVVNKEDVLVGLVCLEDIVENLILSQDEAVMLEKLTFLADFFSETFDSVSCISPLVLAEDMMHPKVISVKEDDSMMKSAVLMKKKNVYRLIVVDENNKPIGYVSRNEICKALIG